MNKDSFNISEIYHNLLSEYARANGNILLEDVNLPAGNTSPDRLFFDGENYNYDLGKAFSFLGENGDILAYTNETHPIIFSSFEKLAGALGIVPFPSTMSYLKYQYDGFKPSQSKKLLKDDGVGYFGKLNKEDLKFFAEVQKSSAMGDTRKTTKSGRIWDNIPSKSVGKKLSIIAFWCGESEVTEKILEDLKANFKLGEIYWAAMDSKNFNAHVDEFVKTSEGNRKIFKSRIYPQLSHDDIVDILIRAHTSGFSITPAEKRVVWEFRGTDPSEVRKLTGGFDTPAEYNYYSRMSESTDHE